MNETPLANYIITISPDQPNQIRNLFELGSEYVSGVIEHPDTFRFGGWDLKTKDTARIKNGEFLEVGIGAMKKIHLYEDGTLIVRGAIDSWFLGWGKMDEGFENDPRVHALAITEFTTATVHLYKKIIPFLVVKPKDIEFHIEITKNKIGDKNIYIVPYKINSTGWIGRDDQYRLESDNPSYEGKINPDILTDDPDQAAYELVKRLFLFFGVPSNKIPYTKATDGVWRVDTDEIRGIK